MDDTILGGEHIFEAVTQLRLHRAGGPSGMKAEQLRMWHRAAKRKENPNPGIWEKVTAIIQADFRRGELAAPCA